MVNFRDLAYDVECPEPIREIPLAVEIARPHGSPLSAIVERGSACQPVGLAAPGLSIVKRALLAIEGLRDQLDRVTEPIAIVGMGCRFPGSADNPERFWDLLKAGRDAFGEVPPDRFDVDSLCDPDPKKPGKMTMRRGAFLDHVDGFDAAFFRISPREAAQTDPQQRLFLEVAWEALESAGIDPTRLDGSLTGVYAGVFSNDYAHLDVPIGERVDPYYFSGVGLGFNANRLSYSLGLRGPSLTVDTACSSSLVALHLAIKALRLGECHLALAGGVSLILSPEISMFLTKAGTLSPTGLCRAFDKHADGLVRGEGCGVVVLKRLTDAQAADDRILAVVRGSAVNHGGASGGLTVPNPNAHADLYRAALRDARVDPDQVGHLEAHGTGTHLGDPIELRGLAMVYGGPRREPACVGSVKTNIGHTDAAAGIAGLIKSVLILGHREIPPSLGFLEANPEFDWPAHAFEVPTRCRPLGNHKVAVSAFGLGGTNAHVILGAGPEPKDTGRRTSGPLLLALSAQHPVALGQLADAVCQRLSRATGHGAVDICTTAARSRAGLPCRLAVGGRDGRELTERLRQWLANPPANLPEAMANPAWKTVFVFPGQGGQWFGMGWQLCRENPVFAAQILAIDAVFRPLAGRGILPGADADPDSIDETEIVQPALFAMQLGLAAVWHDLGIRPDAVVGHSLGEVAAAHVAGCLDLADAVSVIYHRSRILQGATGQGKMLSVALGLDQAEALIEPYRERVSVAVSNSPNAVVLSGDVEVLEVLAARLERRGTFQRELRVRFASHCPQMDRYRQPLRQVLAHLRVKPPALPIYSTVTGHLVEGARMDADYWADNIREPVRFSPVMTTLINAGANTFVELSPHPVLDSTLRNCLDAADRKGIVVGSTRREQPEQAVLLESCGELYRAGYPVDLERINPKGRVVDLPHYPWQRQRYWLRTGAAGSRRDPAFTDGHPLLGQRQASPLPQGQYQSLIRRSSPEFLADHGVGQVRYLPAAALLEMALAAAQEEGLEPAVSDLKITGPLALDDDYVRLQLVVEPGDRHRNLVVYSSRDGRQWLTHATAVLGVSAVTVDKLAPAAVATAPPEQGEALDVESFYTDRERCGYHYSGHFRAIRRLWRSRDQVVAEIAMPADCETYSFHPAALDACTHAALALLTDGLFVPVAVDRFQWLSRPRGELRCVVRRRPPKPGVAASQFDIDIDDIQGPCARIRALTLQDIAGARIGRPAWQDWCFQLHWTAKPVESFSHNPRDTFLVFADRHSKGQALIRFLEDRGHECVAVRPGSSSTQLDARRFELDPGQPEHVHGLLDQLEREGRSPSHVVFAWGLDIGLTDQYDEIQWRESFRTVYGGVLHLAQALEALRPAPRLWLLTTGAHAMGGERVRAGQAGLWGFGRVAARELPSLSCCNVDLDPDSDDPRSLYRELCSQPGDSQVLLRRGWRHVLRLEPVSFPPGSQGPFRLGLDRYGQLDDLRLRPMPVRQPGPGEVLIRTLVVPLNFRDALNALGMLSEYAAELGIHQAADMHFGFECGGLVMAVGEGVGHLAVGDRVVAGPINGALASHVIADARRVFTLPSEQTLEAVASLPVVFMTACYGLEHLAKLRAGEKVLIHAAAGGVGLVAVQLARQAGAEIYATAHPDKWPVLRAAGITHLLSSRDDGFGSEVLRLTGGRGVDVVLNSLAGPMIEASLRACAPNARFIEIGKKDIWSAEQVARVRPDLRYHAFTFSEVADRQPDLVARLQRELVDRLADGRLQSLPLHRFDLKNVVPAFRFLAQARHVGKVILDMPQPGGAALRADACYWITGGMGGLGLEVARRFLDRGARHVLLTGRREADPRLEARLQSLRQDGARVEYRACDVSSGPAVRRLMLDLDEEGVALRGVIHAAGTIDDAMMAGQNLNRLFKVFEPKGMAAFNLHRATAAVPLDFFVIFSSTAAILGPPGQANYAIANAIIDAMAHDRRAQGLPALSLNWGPWAEAGLAAEMNEQNRRRLAARGMSFIDPDQGLAAMEALMALPLAQAAVVPIDWDRHADSLPSRVLAGMFEHLTRKPRQTARPFLAELERAPPPRHRALLESFVREQIARALGLVDGGRISAGQRLFDLGVDSLMAVELRNRLEAGLKKPLRTTLIFDFPRVDALTQYLADEVLHLAHATVSPDIEMPGDDSALNGIDSRTADELDLDSDSLERLSERELASLVDEKLAAVSRFLGDDS